MIRYYMIKYELLKYIRADLIIKKFFKFGSYRLLKVKTNRRLLKFYLINSSPEPYICIRAETPTNPSKLHAELC